MPAKLPALDLCSLPKRAIICSHSWVTRVGRASWNYFSSSIKLVRPFLKPLCSTAGLPLCQVLLDITGLPQIPASSPNNQIASQSTADVLAVRAVLNIF